MSAKTQSSVKQGEIIRIVKSIALAELRLVPLVGLRGLVTECLYDRKEPGAMVKLLDGKYMGATNWFIPLASLQNEQLAEKRKKKELINNLNI